MPIWPEEIHACEPVYGWIQRAAAANYAYSTEGFLWSLGINGKDWDYEAMLEIAEQLPLPELPSLRRSTPLNTSGGLVICGHQTPSRFFSKTLRRVCPACLVDSRYIRTWFDLVPMATCPIHDVALIEGNSDDPIDWRNPILGTTRSGVLISEQHSVARTASPLDHYLHAAMMGTVPKRPSHLADETLNSVLAASLCLGKLLSSQLVRDPTTASLREFTQAGFTPLQNGRDDITSRLSKADWLISGTEKRDQRKRLEHAPALLAAIPAKALRTLIADCLGSVRVRNGLSIPTGPLARFDGLDGFWTLKSVANKLNIEPRYLTRLLWALSIEPERCPRGRTYRLSSSQVQAVRTYIDASFSASELAKHLGCSVNVIDDLVRRKFLQVDFRIGGERHFQRTAVEFIKVRALKKRSVDMHAEATSACNYSLESGLSLVAIYCGIVSDGSILLVDLDEGSPFFDGAKVVATPRVQKLSRKRTRPKAQVKEAITLAAAAARIGTGSHGLQQLIDLSYIEVTKPASGQTRVCEISLRKFEAKYARAALYAPLLGCHPRSALRFLREMGILPINESTECWVRFVSREDVATIVGLKLDGRTGFAEVEMLQQDIETAMMTRSIPATASILADPAIVIRATTGKWALRVESKSESKRYRLTSKFRRRQEPARLKKIEVASITPQCIWPGATVHRDTKGGFVLEDEIGLQENTGPNREALIMRCLERALQLHRLL